MTDTANSKRCKDTAAQFRPEAEVLLARQTVDALQSELTVGDPSDVWPQHEVYNHIFAPLAVHLRRLCEALEASGGR